MNHGKGLALDVKWQWCAVSSAFSQLHIHFQTFKHSSSLVGPLLHRPRLRQKKWSSRKSARRRLSKESLPGDKIERTWANHTWHFRQLGNYPCCIMLHHLATNRFKKPAGVEDLLLTAKSVKLCHRSSSFSNFSAGQLLGPRAALAPLRLGVLALEDWEPNKKKHPGAEMDQIPSRLVHISIYLFHLFVPSISYCPYKTYLFHVFPGSCWKSWDMWAKSIVPSSSSWEETISTSSASSVSSKCLFWANGVTMTTKIWKKPVGQRFRLPDFNCQTLGIFQRFQAWNWIKSPATLTLP